MPCLSLLDREAASLPPGAHLASANKKYWEAKYDDFESIAE